MFSNCLLNSVIFLLFEKQAKKDNGQLLVVPVHYKLLLKQQKFLFS